MTLDTKTDGSPYGSGKICGSGDDDWRSMGYGWTYGDGYNYGNGHAYKTGDCYGFGCSQNKDGSTQI